MLVDQSEYLGDTVQIQFWYLEHITINYSKMAFKFITLFAACLAVASAGLIPAAAPLAAVAQVEEYDPHPQYSYGYDVKDAISGDSKTAVETRDGGFVQGQYSLNDADGYRRIVDYTSDPINGFNAVVRREPLVAAVAAPVVKAAPVVAAPAAVPFTYAAAPVVKAAAPLVAGPAVFITFFAACLAVASAGVIPAAPLAAVAQVEEYDPHPQYSYGYDVKDAISGDSKTAVETRDGGFVKGQYSLNDADGYRRIVDYTSDPINGFNAVVRREPLVAAVAAPVVAAPAPVVKAAPVVAAPAAVPFTYAAAPVAAPFTYAAAPVVKAATPYVAGPAVVKTTFASPLISYAY
ncbi:Pupal cuticle protein Edg-84A [Lucilia cuprina]|uniref:Pupal cuticle protein Edg-84A n=1 Tax=Lucilia cuprina TaxID=7375 RepID=A0A0L0CTU0_LUCCU|nr:Pupal cuticle protein Edg-84A [Lucilia cuprina]